MDASTAKVMLALNEEIERLWRYLEYSEDAQKYRRQANEWHERTEGLRKELEAYLIKISQQTSQYLTAAAVLGFAGYFTIWNFSSSLLSVREHAVVGLCGLVSLSTYVLWEVSILQLRMKSIAEMGSLLRDMVDPEMFEDRRSQIVRAEARLMRMGVPVWRIVVATTIGLLLIGAFVMGKSMFAHLWVKL